MKIHPDSLHRIMGIHTGFAFSWGLAAGVWLILELELGPLELIIFGTALDVSLLLFEVPTGVIADVYGRKISLILANIVMGAGMILPPLISSFTFLLIWQMLFAVGWTLQTGATTAWITDESETSADTLIVRNVKWSLIGSICGIVFVGIISLYSLILAMVVVGSITALFGLSLMFLMTENREFATTEIKIQPQKKSSLKIFKEGIKIIRGSKTFTLVAITSVVIGAVYASGRLNLLRITELGFPDISNHHLIIFSGIVSISMSLLEIPVLSFIERRIESFKTLALVKLLISILFISGVGLLALASSTWLYIAIIGWIVKSIGVDTTYPLTECIVNRQEESSVRATVLSILALARSFGKMTIAVGIGVVAEVFTIPWGLGIGAFLLFAMALIYVAGERKLEGMAVEETLIFRISHFFKPNASPYRSLNKLACFGKTFFTPRP